MNTFAVVVFCVQACLVQNVFTQCTSRAAVAAELGPIAPAGLAAYPLGAPFAYDGLAAPFGMTPAAAALAPAAPFGYRAGMAELAYPAAAGWAAPYEAAAAGWAAPYEAAAAYGGAGEGNVAAAGELPVAGTTAVAGQVPIMGAVNFGGDVVAAGTVSITGKCACGCGAPYEYMY